MPQVGAGIYNANTPPTVADKSEVPLRVANDGSLYTTGGGVSTADGASFTPGTTTGTIAQGVYESTPTTVSDNDAAAIGIDNKRNVKTTLATALARTIDSVTAYQASCEITIVDLATDADVVVTASPAVLLGFYVDTVMSAHAALIKDNATTKITVAASTAAGTKYDTHSALFATNITVESDNAATGKLAIFWRAA